MDKQKVNKVWAAVTQTPKAPIRALAEATGLPLTATLDALKELYRLGHVLPAPAIGAPRKIVVGLYPGRAVRGNVKVRGKPYPIVGEVRGDGSAVQLYEEFAAA